MNVIDQITAEVEKATLIDQITAEVEKATLKFPTWPTDPLHALAILGEEFGELTKAMLQHTYEPHKGVTVEDIREEAIQTAAMALRLSMSLDKYEYRTGQQHKQRTIKEDLPPKSTTLEGGVTVGPELKPYGRQKEWLTSELIHCAPAAQFCAVNNRSGAQLDHPGGGPLTWVRCPLKNAVGVVRVDGKWHWQVIK